ncbi:alginate export family protein [Gallaecimonas sp. GXIMD4217]|uniref:alginate export family protein n=1 Tax=Gallaecimonas sp. GXIMD4217 TaxID=3131927 RepID=UPI00311B1811
MTARNTALALSALSLSLLAAQAQAADSLTQALTEADLKLNFRYRLEAVDQDGKPEDALASTLRSRITVQTGDWQGLSALAEVDNVSLIGNDSYNSTANGKADYPVVADPKGTDLNQAALKYSWAKDGSVTVGRQRINHNDQRFLGGVGWRQNEQTYDGYRLQTALVDGLHLDYSYLHNVNRIFGPDGAKADLHGAIQALNLTYSAGNHSLALFGYDLDFDTAAALSSRTLGLRYQGKADRLSWVLSYARQSDSGDNSADYDADYWLAELNWALGAVTLGVGYELLGSDNGQAFATPLATLHKFQGFADQFLATPATGIQDAYVKASGSLAGGNWLLAIHDFSADVGGADYGQELDAQFAYPVNKHVKVLAKYAHYNADDLATDTDKLWLMAVASF